MCARRPSWMRSFSSNVSSTSTNKTMELGGVVLTIHLPPVQTWRLTVVISGLLASPFDVTRFIPQPDYRLREAPFIAQGAQTGGAEHEGPGVSRQLETDPADGQHPKEMSAGKKQLVSSHR